MQKHNWFVFRLTALLAPQLFTAASLDAVGNAQRGGFLRWVGNWLFLTSFMLLGFNSVQAAINDTGIKTCSDATQNGLPCPVAGFPGQDAEFGTNAFNFTKIDANGNAMPVTATNHSCVQDNVTGLMWEIKTDDGGLRDKDNTYTFDDAATFAAQVNATNLCGHNDWRVPDPHELASIVDYSIASPGPTIDTNYFPNSVSNWFWTHSPHLYDPSTYAWIVLFDYGNVYLNYRAYYDFVRCVRAGTVTFSSFSFTDQVDGTIKDNNTGLVWAKCPLGQSGTNCETGSATAMPWQQALQAADGLTLAGKSDWRLPNVKELQSVADYTKYSPAISSTYFPNTPSNWFWTASSSFSCNSCAWVVHFDDGDVDDGNRADSSIVRCVRAGTVLFSFSLNKLGTGGGTVTSDPVGLACGSICNFSFPTNTVVKLTATPTAGSVFAGWVGGSTGSPGACSGTATTCSVTMDADKSATATFNLAPTVPVVSTDAPSVVTATSATLQGTVNPKGAVTTVSFDFGSTTAYGVNIAATPASIAATAGATAVSANVATPSSFKGEGWDGGEEGVFTPTLTLPLKRGGNPPTLTLPHKGGEKALSCGSVYHYRVKAGNSVGTTLGTDKAFTTAACTPDFVVTSAVLTPATPTPNGNFSTVVTVKNQGNGAGNAGTLMTWANQASAVTCGAVGDQVALIGTLAAGASKTVTVTGFTAPAATTGTLRSFVDASCATAESNEANNQLATSYSISQPDFTVTNVTVTPISPIINTAFSVAVTVKNLGTVNGDGGQLRLWLNQATAQTCAATGGDKNLSVGIIAAGATKTLTFTGLTLPTVATRILQVLVDATCAKVETSETNNRLTKSYRTTGTRSADLLVTAITLTPATPGANGTFSAAVTVKNQGNAGLASGAYLDVWANKATAVTCGSEGEAWVDVGAVAAGATKTVTVNGIPAGVAGSKTLRAFVDSWCEVAERNETNNQLTKAYSVQ